MLIDSVYVQAQMQHLSPRTGKAYAHWVKKYVLHFHRGGEWRHPSEMGMQEVKQFLTYLAAEQGISASTHNQVLAAIQFLYNDVLGQPLGDVSVLRVRRQKRQREALTRAEIQGVLSQLRGDRRLVCLLLYGSGLRLMEALRLRVKDLHLESGILTARNTKSRRDRVVCVAASVVEPLRVHLEQVQQVWCDDLVAGYAGSSFPPALERKYKNAPREWGWQYVFPASRLTQWEDGTLRRHHLHESAVQKAVKRAAQEAGVVGRVSPHILRHSFATHLLQDGVDIRTVQQMMGHADVRTTMGYLRALDARNVVSPLDRMAV